MACAGAVVALVVAGCEPVVRDPEADMRRIRASIAPYILQLRRLTPPDTTNARNALSAQLRPARTAWLRNRKDPVANFRVAYLIHAGADKKLLPEWSSQSPDLDLVSPGKSVEYDVLRWLVRDRPSLKASALAKGEALLKRSPNDVTLVMELAYLADDMGNPFAQQAIEYADHWLKLDPKAFAPHLTKGGVYMRLDGESGGPMARRAIPSFETYLRLAPKNALARQAAEVSIKYLRELIAKRR